MTDNNKKPDDEMDDAPVTPVGSATVDFARMGLNQIAYVRQSFVDDKPVWSIHAATGDTLGAADTFEQAWGAVVQNNLAPVRVH
jgi:hypothetical protein